MIKKLKDLCYEDSLDSLDTQMSMFWLYKK